MAHLIISYPKIPALDVRGESPVWNNGSLMTSGQTAGQGDPQIRDINSNCASSELAWKIGWIEKRNDTL